MKAQKLNLDPHFAVICEIVYFHLRALRPILCALTTETAVSVAVAIVHFRFDCAIMRTRYFMVIFC